jgi:membrane-bound inhibitor of C-type lysozyme
MDVLEWIEKDLVPLSKIVTYARFTAAEQAEKAERYRCRITGGKDRLTYEGDVSTKTAALETFKILLNSVISTAGAKMSSDEFIEWWQGPATRYIAANAATDSFNSNSTQTNPAMKSQQSKDNNNLNNLKKRGSPTKFNSQSAFTLVVDDFAIKYTNKEDADRLINCMRMKYPFKVDWEAKQYIGINLKWDYINREV